ncbi:MAG: hypothetical protein ACWA44_10815 [Thiotrichales bacterium]
MLQQRLKKTAEDDLVTFALAISVGLYRHHVLNLQQKINNLQALDTIIRHSGKVLLPAEKARLHEVRQKVDDDQLPAASQELFQLVVTLSERSANG